MMRPIYVGTIIGAFIMLVPMWLGGWDFNERVVESVFAYACSMSGALAGYLIGSMIEYERSK
jgi:L-asparagine transporter-like permease